MVLATGRSHPEFQDSEGRTVMMIASEYAETNVNNHYTIMCLNKYVHRKKYRYLLSLRRLIYCKLIL